MPFFKIDNAEIEETTHIDGPGFSLSEAGKTDYIYPIEGWYWFASVTDSRVFFNLPEPA